MVMQLIYLFRVLFSIPRFIPIPLPSFRSVPPFRFRVLSQPTYNSHEGPSAILSHECPILYETIDNN